MIKNQWYAVLDAREVRKNRLTGATRCGEKLVFWRDSQDQVHCIYDKCCHRGASLCKGKPAGDHVACPFHGFEYDGTGKVAVIPANGRGTPVPDNFRVHAYHVREAYGFIWLWYADDFGAGAGEIPFFEDLKSGFTYGQIHETWSVHYTRAIENQLDVVHLPFVHATTIGRGHNSLVNGPVVNWDGDLMTFYVDNEQDRGQRPKRPDEIPDYRRLFHLQFQMPNTWQNCISDDIRIVAAFAPVDEEHTHIYIRFYQRFMKVPGLRQLVNGLSGISNRIILHQDRRVALTQLPKRSGLSIGENLVQGDLPIIEYRRRRDKLQKESD